MAQKTQRPVPETQDRTLRARTARTRPAQRRSARAPSLSRRRPRAHPREALPLSARRAAPPVTPAVAPAPTPPAAASPLEQPPPGSRGPRTGPRQGPARHRSSSAWSEAAAGRAARRGAVGPVAPSPAPAPTRNISWTGWPSTSSSCWRSCRKPHPLDHSRQPRRPLTAGQGGVFVLLVVGGAGGHIPVYLSTKDHWALLLFRGKRTLPFSVVSREMSVCMVVSGRLLGQHANS